VLAATVWVGAVAAVALANDHAWSML